MKTDERFEQLTRWVRQFDGLSDAKPVPASGDASFRRYFRVPADGSYIVMDAPPPQEDCRPFVAVSSYLRSMGLNCPAVLEADLDRGFLLLSDLGSVQYLERIEAQPAHADRLYRDAIDALLTMQRAGQKFQSSLPPYDEKLLRFELSLFHDWLCEKHLGLGLTKDDERRWQSACDVLVDNALQQRRVFVHRDYHSRNLMVTEHDNPGILDFQDAVEGAVTYDLVSLLKDCYIKAPAETIRARANYFFDNDAGSSDFESFMREFDLMGVQRHLKAAGIFARLLHRDGKPGYLKDVPRTLGYVVDIAPCYPELHFLGELIAARVLPGLEAAG